MDDQEREELPMQEYSEEETRTVVFTWHPETYLKDVEYQNVYAFGFMNGKYVCVTREDSVVSYFPPEGLVKPGETPEQAITRIYQEQAQLTPTNLKLLGVVEIEIFDLDAKLTDHYQQLRYYCEVVDDGNFTPNKDDNGIVERRFFPVEKARSYIDYLDFPIEQEAWGIAMRIIEEKNETAV